MLSRDRKGSKEGVNHSLIAHANLLLRCFIECDHMVRKFALRLWVKIVHLTLGLEYEKCTLARFLEPAFLEFRNLACEPFLVGALAYFGKDAAKEQRARGGSSVHMLGQTLRLAR